MWVLGVYIQVEQSRGICTTIPWVWGSSFSFPIRPPRGTFVLLELFSPRPPPSAWWEKAELCRGRERERDGGSGCEARHQGGRHLRLPPQGLLPPRPYPLRRAALRGGAVKGMSVEYVDIEPLPFLNTDLEAGGASPAVEAFRRKILEADGVLFASPEYNYSLSGPLKNAVDWASRPPNVWADKPAAIISVGGGSGGGRAQYHLRQVGVFLNLHFINRPEFNVNAFQPVMKFDSEGNLIDVEAKERLKQVLLSLQAFTLRLK